MKINRKAYQKLRAAKAVWRTIRPDSILSSGRIRENTLTFREEQPVAAGVKATYFVTAYAEDHAACSLTVSMYLYDEQVNALRAIAEGSDQSGLPCVTFDVLTASSAMDGKDGLEPPLIDLEPSAADFAALVDDLSKRVDRIWQFVGGCNAQGVEKLAIWALRNRERAGTFLGGLGEISAAFVYGDPELGHELLEHFRSDWEERLRSDPRDVVLQIYSNVRVCLDRLVKAAAVRTVH
jgi:hypothetical protein